MNFVSAGAASLAVSDSMNMFMKRNQPARTHTSIEVRIKSFFICLRIVYLKSFLIVRLLLCNRHQSLCEVFVQKTPPSPKTSQSTPTNHRSKLSQSLHVSYFGRIASIFSSNAAGVKGLTIYCETPAFTASIKFCFVASAVIIKNGVSFSFCSERTY